MTKHSELIVVGLLIIACQWPTFWFANSIDSDEVLKSGSGTLSAAAIAGIVAAYRVFKRGEVDVTDDS